MSNQPYLLLFSLGPVQSFIATARRAQDLWLGSCLLSDLMRSGMKAAQQVQAELIYPVPGALGDANESGLPNKFVARCADRDTARRAAEAAADVIRSVWQARAKEVRDYLQHTLHASINNSIWARQTNPDHLLEIYWAAVQWPQDQAYGQVYAEVSRMLAARKNLRDFVQVEEPGWKCSLCGEREVLYGRLSDKVAKQKPHEQLCAVCVVKRFDADARSVEERFPSTSSVATAPFVLELLDNWATTEVLKDFRSALSILEDLHPRNKHVLTHSAHPEAIPVLRDRGGKAIRKLDGDLYFPETFQPGGRLKNDYEFEESAAVREKAEAAKKALDALRNAVLEATGQSPTLYYAVLLMDGDRMGQRLSSVQSEEEHRTISQALFQFSRQQVPDIVERQHLGRLVYAGGDDVLALLPVPHVLSVAQQLQEAFGQALAGGTLSAGVAIAHHLSPLQAVLDEARTAEQAAKNDYGRNALCVALLRRSGATTRVGAQWSFGCDQKTINVLARVQEAMAKGHLSSRVAHDVAEVAPTLGAASIPNEAKVAEVRRLLRRHSADDHKETTEELAEPLVSLAETLDRLVRRKDRTISGLEEMANWLLLMRFLAGEARGEE
jgi:CRISPR-associated protein Cmr2